jgi:hypothetical protein
VEPGKDDLSIGFEERLLGDPVLHPLAGPEQVDQLARWAPIDLWLGQGVDVLRSHAGGETGDSADAEVVSGQATAQIADLQERYVSLMPEQKSVVMYLHAIHQGPVLFPMALVLGKCTPAEYAQGVMAGQALLAGVFGDVNDKAHRNVFEGLRSDARTALEYIRFYREGTPSQRLRDLIASGEGSHLEFKSTLRWNMLAKRNDEAITHACVKTIAAFLNTDGGQLLIGVADDSSIVGIEQDRFENNDKFQLHLFNVLKQSLGPPAAAYIEAEVLPVGERSVCIVTCRRSTAPVYCRLKTDEDERFYIRTGPGTTQLPPSSIVKYVADHFSS